MRLPAAPLVVLLVAGLAAEAALAGSAGRSEEAAVRGTVRAAINAALRDGNFARACRFASPKGTLRLITRFSAYDQRDYKSCEEVVKTQVRDPFSRQLVGFLRHRIVLAHARLRGTRARISVGYQHGRDADSTWVSLRKIAGHWRITNSGWIPPARQCGSGP